MAYGIIMNGLLIHFNTSLVYFLKCHLLTSSLFKPSKTLKPVANYACHENYTGEILLQMLWGQWHTFVSISNTSSELFFRFCPSLSIPMLCIASQGVVVQVTKLDIPPLTFPLNTHEDFSLN